MGRSLPTEDDPDSKNSSTFEKTTLAAAGHVLSPHQKEVKDDFPK